MRRQYPKVDSFIRHAYGTKHPFIHSEYDAGVRVFET